MKNILLLLWLLIGVAAHAQVSEPFKKANLILVTFEKVSAEDAFKMAGRTLIDAGYTINKSDANFLSIQTNTRTIKGGFGSFTTATVLIASVKTVENGRTELS